MSPPPFTLLGETFGFDEKTRWVIVPLWTTATPANDETFIEETV